MTTLVALLTPPATGAIATLALYGPDAWAVVKELFVPAGNTSARHDFFEQWQRRTETETFWLGRFGDAKLGGVDEVVVVLKSAAPVPSFEIHCHGGLQVIALLEEAIIARGVHKCSWQELWTLQKEDAVQPAALAALAEASTTRTAAILLDQYHGALTREIAEIVDLLQKQDERATAKLQALARWSTLGQHLTKPWKVVVAGAPNVGKSSLINRLAGHQRCVVAPTPGTTRDVVSTRNALDGWPVELVDTAGQRESGEALEQEGIDLARTVAAEADLCLWLVDSSAAPVWPPSMPHVHLVVNKIDLPPAWDLETAAGAVRVSATTGAGVEELCQSISRWLVPAAPPAGTAVPFTGPLCTAMQEAMQHCLEKRWREAIQVLQ
jgi:tRNA modification GTPase